MFELMVYRQLHMIHSVHDLEESASHPLPLLEGAPQVDTLFKNNENREKWCEALSSRLPVTARLSRGGSSTLWSRTTFDQ